MSSLSPRVEMMDGDGVAAIDKQRRYDRGIRIWGAHGQEALENARICLLNCGPTGSESLKNLVLGGIHSFTIVDGNRVQAQDLGNNYLITADFLGSSRAQCVTECLKELNETVSGFFIEEDPQNLVNKNPSFFKDFSLVIATQLQLHSMLQLDAICRDYSVPLIITRSYGLAGIIRNCIAEHCVIESKPENAVNDLRAHAPWSELATAASSIDLDALDEADHSHVPYGLLLVKAAQVWKESHCGKLPSTRQERSEFKQLLVGWQRTIDDVPIPEENFAEALAQAHTIWAPPMISREMHALFEDESATHITESSADFWIMIAALSRFVQQEGHGSFLPLDGSLPDMHATTQRYLELQRIYKEKADADAAAVERHASALLNDMGHDPRPSITSAAVRHICKHARHLRVIRTPKLQDDVSSGAATLRAVLSSEDSNANGSMYVVLMYAIDKFYRQYQRYPGLHDDDMEDDVGALKAAAAAVMTEAGVTGVTICDDVVVEMVRCGASELHIVGAVMGAMVSQEAIKLITKQYVPFEGTLVYNGMQCTTTVVKP